MTTSVIVDACPPPDLTGQVVHPTNPQACRHEATVRRYPHAPAGTANAIPIPVTCNRIAGHRGPHTHHNLTGPTFTVAWPNTEGDPR